MSDSKNCSATQYPNDNFLSNYSKSPHSSEYSGYISQNKWQSINEKPVSLRNFGAHCYLNAGFQAISACSEFIKEMKKLLNDYPTCEKLKTFNELMEKLQNPDVRETILEISKNKIFQNWNKSGQQDSLELLNHVFNEIYDEIKTENKIPKNKLESSLKLPLRIIFENNIKCCVDVRTLIQCDLAFHIPIYKNQDSSSIKLKDLIERFFNKEKIEDYNCEQSNCSGANARKTTKLCLPLPNTICIHLQRLYWDNEKMNKIVDKVEFDEEIIMKKSFFQKSTPDKSQDEIYYLKSVIEHYGDASFGHYICYKLFKENWFYTSDSFITKENIQRILNCEAYILFYENRKDIQDANNYKRSSDSLNSADKTSQIGTIRTSISKPPEFDNKKFEYKSRSDKSSETQTFELSPFESILIEALSSCSTFVKELNKIHQGNITDKNRKIINLILKQNSPFNYKSTPNRNINFDYNYLKTVLISIFNNGLNTKINIESNQENLTENYPFKFSFHFKIKCPCGQSIEYFTSEVALILENVSYNLQKSLDIFFEEEKSIQINGIHISCNFSHGYRNIKLKSIPNIICIYIKNYHPFKMNSIKEIKIKKSYFSSYVDNDDYVYNLKSVLYNSWNGYGCYRLYGNEWYHIAKNETKKLDSYSDIECKIMFFEQSSESKETNNNFKTSRNQNLEIRSNNLINKENNTSNNLNIHPNESNKINSIISDDIYYLKIVLHALSSCESFSRELIEMIHSNIEHSNLLSTKRYSIEDVIKEDCLLKEIVNKMNFHCEMNLFQLLSKIFSQIFHKWPENPFLITKRNIVECSNCHSPLQEHEERKMSFDIPVIRKYETIHLQDYIEKSFDIQNLDGVSCPRNECSRAKKQIVRKLCEPIPKIICFHIENLVWNGEKNEFMDATFYFRESVTLQFGIYEDHLKNQSNNTKKLTYNLKSILVFDSYSTKYVCYKKFNENWHEINESSRRKISIYEVMNRKPYILFYERFD